MKNLILIPLFFVLVACGDDEKKKEDPQPTKTDLLTAHKWHRVSTVDPEFYFTFKSTGAITLQATTGNYNGTWEFAENETVILVNLVGAGNMEYNLIKLTTDELIIRDPTSTEDEKYIPA